MCSKFFFFFLVLCLVESSQSAFGQLADIQEAAQDLQRRDFAAAIEASNRAIALDPGNPHYIFLRAVAYNASGDYEHSIQDLTQVINRQPDNFTAYLIRSGCYFSLHQIDSALADLNKTIELNPKLGRAYAIRGDIYSGRGEFDKAIPDLTQALSLNSSSQDTNDSETLNIIGDRAHCYAGLQKFDLATSDVNTILQNDPNNVFGLLVQAQIYFKQNDYDHALVDLSHITKINPQNDTPFTLAGHIRTKQGLVAQAVRDYEKALGLNPESVEANNSLAWLLATSPDASFRDGKRAVTLAQKACDLNLQKADPAALDTLAASYAEAGDFPDAVKTEGDAIKALLTPDPKFDARLALYQQNQPYREPSH